MAEEWTPVPGHGGLHEKSDRGRVRTTAAGSLAKGSLLWLILLLTAAVVWAYRDQIIAVAHTVDVILTVAVCVPPVLAVVGWLLVQLVGEWRLRRMYDRPAVPAKAMPLAEPVRVAIEAPKVALAIAYRPPLAIEAAPHMPRRDTAPVNTGGQ